MLNHLESGIFALPRRYICLQYEPATNNFNWCLHRMPALHDPVQYGAAKSFESLSQAKEKQKDSAGPTAR